MQLIFNAISKSNRFSPKKKTAYQNLEFNHFDEAAYCPGEFISCDFN
jgi:hypothetical protein